MGIFDKMLTESCKREFFERKSLRLSTDEKYLCQLSEYLFSNECDNDVRRLKSGDYFFDAPTFHLVRKNHSTERRKVFAFEGKSKLLLQFMTFMLMELDDTLPDSLCSFRRGDRTKMFFNKVRRLDRGRTHYVMKTDVHDYGGSIDQDMAIELVERMIPNDPEFMAFFKWIMTRNEFYRQGKLVCERVSIIEGFPIGSFVASVFLTELDRLLESQADIYMRYNDDIAFFTDSYEKALWALEQTRDICAKKGLSLNERKTTIVSPGEPAELLGIEILDGDFDIGENSLQKQFSKLKRFRDKLLRGVRYGKITKAQAFQRMVRFTDRIFYGVKIGDHEFNWVMHAFPMITRTNGLERLDKYAQDCIRVAGTGKLGNAKYRIRYKDMCEAGYRSLVHAYYHGSTIEELTTNEAAAHNADTIIG